MLCKWVSEDMKTMNDTKWEVGVAKELPEKDDLELCEEGLFHYFRHPLLAVLLKDFYYCGCYRKLYQVKPEGKFVKDWDICGSTKLTLVKELRIPQVTYVQKVCILIGSILIVSGIFVGAIGIFMLMLKGMF